MSSPKEYVQPYDDAIKHFFNQLNAVAFAINQGKEPNSTVVALVSKSMLEACNAKSHPEGINFDQFNWLVAALKDKVTSTEVPVAEQQTKIKSDLRTGTPFMSVMENYFLKKFVVLGALDKFMKGVTALVPPPLGRKLQTREEIVRDEFRSNLAKFTQEPTFQELLRKQNTDTYLSNSGATFRSGPGGGSGKV